VPLINYSSTLPYLLPLAWSGVEPDVTAAAFRAIRRSGPKGLISGTTGLVALGGVEGLESLEGPEIQGRPELQHIVLEVERFYRSPSAKGTEILSRWLQSGQPVNKRHAAAGALARIHTPGAILALGIALNDSDFDMRWRAIGGLSMFANNVPVGGAGPAPGAWPFRTGDSARFSVFDKYLVQKDEQRYLAFWRRWWDENHSAISNLAAQQGR